jgi:putative flippase GtrA
VIDTAKIGRFLATGLLNTAFGYGLYVLLVASGLPYLPALVVATAAGVIFNYFSFGRLAFRATLARATFARFLAGYGLALSMNAVLLWAAHERLGIDPYTAQLLCLPPTVAATYLILNRWVYADARSHGS